MTIKNAQIDLRKAFVHLRKVTYRIQEAILYGLLFKLSPDNKVCKNNAKKVLGEKMF